MLSHNVGLREPLLADRTLVGLVSCVRLNVSHRLLSLTESTSVALATFPLTDVLALASADVVLAQMGGERIIIGEGPLTTLPSTTMLFLSRACVTIILNWWRQRVRSDNGLLCCNRLGLDLRTQWTGFECGCCCCRRQDDMVVCSEMMQ